MIRGLLFKFIFYLGTVFVCLIFLPALILPKKVTLVSGKILAHLIIFLLRFILGVKVNISGIENYNNYKKGEEVAMFNLGSTVIVLIGEIKKSQWCDNINVGQKILIRDDILKIN